MSVGPHPEASFAAAPVGGVRAGARLLRDLPPAADHLPLLGGSDLRRQLADPAGERERRLVVVDDRRAGAERAAHGSTAGGAEAIQPSWQIAREANISKSCV